jgi:hypothetical protein
VIELKRCQRVHWPSGGIGNAERVVYCGEAIIRFACAWQKWPPRGKEFEIVDPLPNALGAPNADDRVL